MEHRLSPRTHLAGTWRRDIRLIGIVYMSGDHGSAAWPIGAADTSPINADWTWRKRPRDTPRTEELDAIVAHPRGADAAVIGAPDAEMGERVVAVVQQVDGRDAGPALADELTPFLQDRIGRIEQPRQIDFRPELPRHPTGKLLNRLVRCLFFGRAGAIACRPAIGARVNPHATAAR